MAVAGFQRPVPLASPRAASRAVGAAQRARLHGRLGAVRWWTVAGGVAATVLFTGLAVRHTDAASAPPAAQSGQTLPDAPSQSLFQGQAGSDGSGGFLAPAPRFGRSPFRSSSS
jgi:hypothetical protein